MTAARATKAPPTLASVVRKTIERALAQIRVAGPARVVSFDRTTRTCKVAPLIRRPGKDGGTTEEPAIGDVPILWPGTKKHRIRFPLEADDTVLLVHLDLASDDWALLLQQPTATKPKPVDPAEVRSHDYTDVVAIPLSTFAAALQGELSSGLAPMDDRLVLENGDAQLALIDGGLVALGRRTPGGGPSVELLEQLILALGVLEGAFPALTPIRTALLTIKGSL